METRGAESRARGKLIQQFGASYQKTDILYPEEVCYLLEREVIVLLVNDAPMDATVRLMERKLIQTFKTQILPKYVPTHHYAAFRELRLNSYRVYRPLQ